MPSFTMEIRTIQALLIGSRWGADPAVQVVHDEYEHFVGARRLRVRERKTSLQILFASRAIDSLLGHVVRWEFGRPAGAIASLPRYLTLGGSITRIRNHGINGYRFSRPTENRLLNDLTSQRNRFMHEAGSFPTDAELATFLADTLAGIQEIIVWR